MISAETMTRPPREALTTTAVNNTAENRTEVYDFLDYGCSVMREDAADGLMKTGKRRPVIHKSAPSRNSGIRWEINQLLSRRQVRLENGFYSNCKTEPQHHLFYVL